MKYRGITGQVRKCIDTVNVKFGNTVRPGSDFFIFNDKRKKTRRLKIWSDRFTNNVDMAEFEGACRAEFGESFIRIGVNVALGYRGCDSVCVFLKLED